MKDAGVQLVFTAIDQHETLIVAKEMAKQHLDAVQFVNNLYDPKFARDNAQLLEGDFVAPQFAALENKPLLQVEQDFVEWMDKSGKPVSELAGYGWISALQFVHGLKLAGPRAYGGVMVEDAYMGDGRREAGAADIRAALRLFVRACAIEFAALVAVAVLLSWH